jgi:glycosyltransferase involved in cell wall biosynthesis
MIAKTIVRTMGYVDRVIVVDDGSVDDTCAIAKGLGALTYRHSRNRGKGQALRTIFRAARELQATVLVTLDADAQHHPADIPEVVAPILSKEADIAIGSRFEGDSTPALRRTGQKFLDLTTAVHDNNGKIVDSQSGFRAYSEKAIHTLDFGESGMGVESESLRKAAQRGLKIIQVPVAVSYGRETDHTLNPILHFTDVVSAIAKQALLKRPVRFLGIPSAALIIGGLYWWILILDAYNHTREFAIGNAIVASVVLMLGFFLGISSLILLALVLIVQESR